MKDTDCATEPPVGGPEMRAGVFPGFQLGVADTPTSAITVSVILTVTTFCFGATTAYVTGSSGKIFVYRLPHA